MRTLEEFLTVAHQALDLAERVIHRTPPGELTAKSDRDMASDVDYSVERELRRFLGQQDPEIGFLGEEDGHEGRSELYWAIDPIDGTANFVHGIPLRGVSLGLVRDGRSVVIHASKTSQLNSAIVAIGDYAVGSNSRERNTSRLALTARLSESVQRVRMHGSAALDLAWVAHGRLDAMVMFSKRMTRSAHPGSPEPGSTAADPLVSGP